MAGLRRLYSKLRRVPNELQLYEAVMAGRVSPDLAITCRGKRDGGGAQANACISAMAFAAATGLRYLHTPFQYVEHAPGDPAEWTRAWEEFFGLGQGETVIGQEHEAVGIKKFLDTSSLWKKSGVTVEAQHFLGICNAHPEFYTAIIPRLWEKYAASDKSGIALDRGDEDLMVAVHIRRGDVSKHDAVTGNRFTDDELLLQKVRDILEVTRDLGLSARVNIYSQGKPEDFAAFAQLGCHLQIDKDAFETVHNLAMSDVLVTAKSAFSFVAGLLSKGVKIYEPFDTVPPGDWMVSEAADPLDKVALRAKISDFKA